MLSLQEDADIPTGNFLHQYVSIRFSCFINILGMSVIMPVAGKITVFCFLNSKITNARIRT